MTNNVPANEILLEAANRYGFDTAELTLLLDGERLVLMDFEERCYCWYAFDLAVSLTYAVLASWRYDILDNGNRENDQYVQHVWDMLQAGYRRENALPDQWLEAMPVFLRFRAVQDYVHGLLELASGSIEEWLLAFLQRQRYIIEHNISFDNIRWL